MSRLSLAVLLLLATPGCAILFDTDGGDGSGKQKPDGDPATTAATVPDDPVDSDGDGLLDDDELALGTDPALSDTDGDGLADGDELGMGTNPVDVDTDADGYQDGWETTEGTDPTDAESRIYEGNWPYNPDKDAMDDPGWRGSASEGDQLPRFAWKDQFGDTVDVYDFANHGKPVVLDLSGVWCYYCNEVAKFMDHQASIWDDYRQYRNIPDMVEDGEIYWITALDSDASGNAISTRDLKQWYEAYPNPYIPVLADEEYQLQDWMSVVGYPSIMLLNEDLTVAVYDKNNYGAVFDALLDL